MGNGQLDQTRNRFPRLLNSLCDSFRGGTALYEFVIRRITIFIGYVTIWKNSERLLCGRFSADFA
jgi:hypothetical protein